MFSYVRNLTIHSFIHPLCKFFLIDDECAHILELLYVNFHIHNSDMKLSLSCFLCQHFSLGIIIEVLFMKDGGRKWFSSGLMYCLGSALIVKMLRKKLREIQS